jgi:hypothetical protein
MWGYKTVVPVGTLYTHAGIIESIYFKPKSGTKWSVFKYPMGIKGNMISVEYLVNEEVFNLLYIFLLLGIRAMETQQFTDLSNHRRANFKGGADRLTRCLNV